MPLATKYAPILTADRFTAAHIRQALREQEPILQSYVNLLIKKFNDECNGPRNGVVDVVRWYNFLTFDIIGDLTYGENFNTLEAGDYSFFALSIYQAAKAIAMGLVIRLNSWAQPLLMPLLGAALKRREEIWAFSTGLVDKRRSMDTSRPDFMTFAQKHEDDEKGIPLAEMYASFFTIVGAGSETTATTLSGVTYFLTTHPEKLQKLQNEVRSRFERSADITIEAVNSMPYLIACLTEGLRMYPPVPLGFPRKVPPGGDTISGHFIPGDVSGIYPQSINAA